MAQYLCIWVGAYWFSATSLSKWPPGGHIGFFGFRTNFSLAYIGHIRFFGFWTAWFQQRNSSLLLNFSFKFYVHVLCGFRQKPYVCQLCRFQNGCLVILKMFNCNPPIAHCHPLLWGEGILVDHWSTISSFQGHPLNFKVKLDKKNCWFWPELSVSGL